MSFKKKQLTKSELILEAWEHIDSNSAGAYELGVIQKKLEAEIGSGFAESPASVARTLADALMRFFAPGDRVAIKVNASAAIVLCIGIPRNSRHGLRQTQLSPIFPAAGNNASELVPSCTCRPIRLDGLLSR
jgi:hypothetical protein